MRNILFVFLILFSTNNYQNINKLYINPINSSNSLIEFEIWSNYTSDFKIYGNDELLYKIRLNSNHKRKLYINKDELQYGLMKILFVDSSNKTYKGYIKSHNRIESVNKNNLKIYNNCYFYSSEINIFNNNYEYVLFEKYESFVEQNYYFDLNVFPNIFVNYSCKFETYLIVHLSANVFKYINFSFEQKGYVFPLINDIRNNKIKLFFKDDIYYEPGSLQICTSKRKDFVLLNKICLPNNTRIKEIPLTLVFKNYEYRILYNCEFALNI